MNKLLLSTFFLLISTKLVFAQPQEIKPISFGGGVDYKSDCSAIDDSRACDMNNMVSDFTGTTQKRYGSKRYIDQAISSFPVKGLYRAFYSTGSTVWKHTLMINNGKVYVDTTTSITGKVWTEKKSGLDKAQNYSFAQYGQYVLICGDSLKDNVLKYDIITSSVSENYSPTSSEVLVTAKHQVFSKDYYILANIKEFTAGTTYYPSRVHYSQLLDTSTHISSMSVLRQFDVSDDGEEITGIGEINNVHIFKPSSISELAFSALNLTSQGGNQTLAKIVKGFGCIAPRTLVNNGKFYTFLSWDGIRVFDPTGRLSLSDETKIISTSIEPIIKKILENGTASNCHAVYYPKKNWYIFSYEDPEKYPKGKPNSTIVYDFNINEWFPFSNWLPECYATFDNTNDLQEIVYGDTMDGYVFYIDQETFSNDARKEIVIDNCDSHTSWKGITAGSVIKEGTASIKITMNASQSSATIMKTINLGEWYDKSKTDENDKISFKVYPSSLSNIISLRIDLELDTVSDAFSTYFTSVTISSSALTNGTSAWSTVEISLSSFTILDSWIDVSSGILPFANSPTFYGIRFVATSTAWSELTIDDIRFVKESESELNAYRLSKQFNLQTSADKRWRQIVLNCDQPATTRFYIDYFSNFGDFEYRDEVENTVEKHIFMTGYNGQEGIFKLDANDFSIIDSTISSNRAFSSPRPMTADKNYVYVGDQYNHRILKYSRDDLSVIVASAGSYGSGGNNFNIPFQMAISEKDNNSNLFICDFVNHAVKIYNPKTMKFRKSFGVLGNGATNFFCPTGIAADDKDLFIFQDANYNLQKWDAGTLEYKLSTIVNLNAVGNTKLAVDQKYVYVYYSKISEENLLYTELWLEKRNKSDLKLVSKTKILPEGIGQDSIVTSTYSVQGDIGINDDFIYLTFTNDSNKNGSYYFQKRIKNGTDFKIVKEIIFSDYIFSIASNGLTYKPKRKSIFRDIGTDSQYIQFRFYEDEIDNSFKLYNASPIVIGEEIRER